MLERVTTVSSRGHCDNARHRATKEEQAEIIQSTTTHSLTHSHVQPYGLQPQPPTLSYTQILCYYHLWRPLTLYSQSDMEPQQESITFTSLVLLTAAVQGTKH